MNYPSSGVRAKPRDKPGPNKRTSIELEARFPVMGIRGLLVFQMKTMEKTMKNGCNHDGHHR